MRLAKFLSGAGVAARRKCEELIADGKVTVNGQVITTPVCFVTPENDEVRVSGKLIQPPVEHVYLLLNKPAGYTCTAEDRHASKLIYDLLPPKYRSLRYAGRLDRDTEGLLFLTDDGELIQKLTHPSNQIPKVYLALCEGIYTEKQGAVLCQGIQDDGDFLKAQKAVARPYDVSGQSLLELTLTEGKKREVRRLCARVGLPVLRLARIRQAGISIGDLPVGEYRHLTETEIKSLRC